MKMSLKKYFVEFIGTFVLMLTIGCVVLFGTENVIAPLAIGAALMIMVCAGGYISGGHYNPAVSLAASIRGVLDIKDLLMYWVAQILGGIAAAFCVMSLVREDIPVLTLDFNTMTLIMCEVLFTFVLAYVVLHTATSAITNGNSYYGLAIGAAVMVGAFAVGAIAPAAFNPAVATGLGFLSLISWKSVMFTVLANFLGGILAALVFKMTTFDSRD